MFNRMINPEFVGISGRTGIISLDDACAVSESKMIRTMAVQNDKGSRVGFLSKLVCSKGIRCRLQSSTKHNLFSRREESLAVQRCSGTKRIYAF